MRPLSQAVENSGSAFVVIQVAESTSSREQFTRSFLRRSLLRDAVFLAAMVLAVIVGIAMLRRRNTPGLTDARLGRGNAPALIGLGATAGGLSGFFGIGGGFLIVPALVAATGMPMIAAVGSSLVAVAAFGMTTALNYARTGLVNWKLAAVFVVAGVAGGIAGAATSTKLANYRGALNTVFAVLIFITAAYMLWKVS